MASLDGVAGSGSSKHQQPCRHRVASAGRGAAWRPGVREIQAHNASGGSGESCELHGSNGGSCYPVSNFYMFKVFKPETIQSFFMVPEA